MMRVVLQPAQIGIDRGVRRVLQPVDECGRAPLRAARQMREDGVSGAEVLEERAQRPRRAGRVRAPA